MSWGGRAMIYVERDDSGKIVALYNAPNAVAREQKSSLDEEVLAFFDATDSCKQLMTQIDLSTIRIIEDLIDILVRKNLINFTELPEHAQQRLWERKRLREKIVTQHLVVDEIL